MQQLQLRGRELFESSLTEVLTWTNYLICPGKIMRLKYVYYVFRFVVFFNIACSKMSDVLKHLNCKGYRFK